MSSETNYLTHSLKNPFLVGASPLIYDIDTVLKLEDAGAAGIVMHSLFEEQIVRDYVRGFPNPEEFNDGIFPEASRFPLSPEKYLKHIQKLKERLSIPVFASINGINLGTWVEYAEFIQEAGADGLELNLYSLPNSDNYSSSEIESKALQVVRNVREASKLPIAVKLSPSYTGLPRFVTRLEEAGVKALVCFNRLFQPDIDIENLKYKIGIQLSTQDELLIRLRWIASMHGRIPLDFAVSGGVKDEKDAIKCFMAGATVVQLVSILLEKGPEHLSIFLSNFDAWLDKHGYNSVEQLRGTLSLMHCSDTASLARASYLKSIHSGWNSD